jgi:hypothetical protein
MNATTYTGNGASLSVTNGVAGQSFQPDMVWIKRRNTAADHVIDDSVRGAGKGLFSNLSSAENASMGGFLSFDSGGWSMNGTVAEINQNASTFVGWQWKAGGTAVTNTSGSISAQVSANTTSGFSIATYTGTGSNATVGHGLGVAPSMVIIKQRNTTGAWLVGHTNMTNWTYYLLLNQTAAQAVNTAVWNSTAPTSTVFSIGTDGNVNTNAGTYVAYCWSQIAGYSAFGSYTGNGSTDGPFVYTGFRPRWVLMKSSSLGTGFWWLVDTSRNPYNVMDLPLFPNDPQAETAGTTAIDILSNGFKLRTTNTSINQSGGSMIYAAFAENPFKYANAR